LVSLKDNLATIHTYSAKFSNLDELKYETEIKRNQLMTDQQDLSEKKLQLQTQVNQLQFEYDELQAELACDETHVKLSSLDEKLRQLEEDQETMKTFIDDHKKTVDVAAEKQSTMEIVSTYLKCLAN